MAFAVRELDVDGIPLNVLLPVRGTPLEHLPVMEVADVAKSCAIFRMITGGYLTTRGRSIAEDRAFLASLSCFISAGSGGQMQ